MRARPDREVAVVAVPARPGAILIRPDAAADPADATAVAYAITPRAVARSGRPAALDARRSPRPAPPAIGGSRALRPDPARPCLPPRTRSVAPPAAATGPARDRAANRVRIGTMYPPPND